MPRKKYKYNPIDFVPRRKAGDVIQTELEYEKNKPLGKAPGRVGVDRAALKENLQERFQF